MTSCLGVKADIVFNADNSGTVTVEYRFSQLLESLGKMDGNEAYPVLPVGKTDFERTVARVPGLELLSYHSREEEKDRVIIVRLRFSEPGSLIGFFDTSAEKAAYTSAGGERKMSFALAGGNPVADPDLTSLIRQLSAGYKVEISAAFPGSGSLVLLDNEGKPSPEKGEFSLAGKKVSYSMDMETILFAQDGITLEFTW